MTLMSNRRISKLLQSGLLEAAPYAVPDTGDFIKLDAMENPYKWPAELTELWLAEMRGLDLNRYPDARAVRVKEALRTYLTLGAGQQLIMGNGSDELIQMLVLCIAGSGRPILAPEPTFVVYKQVATWLGLPFVGVPLRQSDLSIDVDAMLLEIERVRPALVFLAYPNNPTANLFDRDDIERIIAACPGLTVLDEAYYPFACRSNIDLLQKYKNVLIMQTLSKLGLAGIRVGWLFGDQDWLEQIEKLRMPYNLSALSQATAAFMLEHVEVLDAQAEIIREHRDALYTRLASIEGIRVWPSKANFLMFSTSVPAPYLHARLREHGVLIKCLDGMHPLVENCLRVTVGLPEETERFLTVLQESLIEL